MNKHWKFSLLGLAALLGTVFSSAAQTNQLGQAAQDLAALKDTYRIVITEWASEHTNRMLITLSDVPRILHTVHLEPKDECYCCHTLHATFKSATHEVQVSFCDHCFDILGPTGENDAHRYKMPKEFYEELQNQVKKQGRHEFQQLKP